MPARKRAAGNTTQHGSGTLALFQTGHGRSVLQAASRAIRGATRPRRCRETAEQRVDLHRVVPGWMAMARCALPCRSRCTTLSRHRHVQQNARCGRRNHAETPLCAALVQHRRVPRQRNAPVDRAPVPDYHAAPIATSHRARDRADDRSLLASLPRSSRYSARSSSATACATTASPAPAASSPSLVFALTLTHAVSMPSAPAIASRIAST